MARIAKHEEVWFDYPANPEKLTEKQLKEGKYEKDSDGARVLITSLKEGESQAIIQKAMDVRISFLGGRAEPAGKFDPERTRKDAIVKRVKNWEKFSDIDGKEMDCKPENVLKFADEDGFNNFINICSVVVDKMAADRKKEVEKN